MDKQDAGARAAWWRERVRSGSLPPCDLPLDRAASPDRSTLRRARVQVPLDAALAPALRPDILTAALAVLLARLGGSAEAGFALLRSATPGEPVVLPLALRLAPGLGVAQLLDAAAAAIAEAEAQALGWTALQAALPDQDPAALARVLLVVDANARGAEAGDGGPVADLRIGAVRGEAAPVLLADFNAGALDESSVRAWLGALVALLESIRSAAPGAPVAKLPWAGESELRRLRALQPAASAYPRDAAAHELFESQVDRTPDRPATADAATRWTYAQLEVRANQYAHVLRARGVARGSLVGISLERGVEMLAALLGTMKAGAGYVPLDPAFPPERLAFMAQDASLAAVVTQAAFAERFALPAERLVIVDATADEVSAAPAARLPRDSRSAGPLDDAFVVYTSGSTGRPKGVRIHHRSAVNFLASIEREPGIAADDVVVAVTTLSFDMHFYELVLPLVVGARNYVATRDEARDGRALARRLAEEGGTFLQTTPATWRMLVEAGWQSRPGFTMVSAGEPLPAAVATAMIAGGGVAWNGYGPSETGYATFWRVAEPANGILIGHPIANSSVWVLDADGNPCPVGIRGELYIGGDCVALGYLARPELTAERFLPDPFRDLEGARLYRTGDRGRWREDGELEVTGRMDQQVKLRGYRIELGEIETQLLACEGVREAVAMVREDVPGDPRLAAYVVFEAAPVAESALRARLTARLPDYMIPSHIVPLDAIPLLPNRKIDRLALPAPARRRPDLVQPYVEPLDEVESGVCRIFASVLGLDRVGRHDHFFELGGSSLLVMRALPRLQDAGLGSITATGFFREPTAAGLVALQRRGGVPVPAAAPRRAGADASRAPVAVVAMAGRFPGATDVEALWRHLLEGRDTVRCFEPGELDPSIPAALRDDPAYVRARGVLDDIEMFDAGFFGIGPREAELMDPQQRIFLELCWEALERAGHVPDGYPGRIGVYAGQYHSGYLTRNLAAHPGLVERFGEFNVSLLNEKDYLATRAAFKLGLTGPAISLYTACSTSLVAIAQAFDALRDGRCDMAIAGGVSITYPHHSGYLYQEGAMLSPDGRTRSFSADAQGTVFSDGAAVVVLKRLDDALADGNPIYAVLRGAAVNNDGGHKASFTAPSAEGQAAVVAAALDVAGVPAASVGYVETHGTATPLGDPIEIEGLAAAFGREGPMPVGSCAIGSVKSNVGHLIIAAGATGLIKAALSLAEERIPASLHVAAPNPAIGFERTPFHVLDSARDWPRTGAPRRAGVSSFGVGGTNAHVVLEEAPQPERRDLVQRPELLLVSARSPAALDTALERLGQRLDEPGAPPLADVAHTLLRGRRAFACRASLVADTAADAAGQLRARDARIVRREVQARRPEVVFMFPGQGSQYPSMGRALHAADPTFRAAFDEVADSLLAEGVDLRTLLLGSGEVDLASTALTQPATFAVEYALARMLMGFGVRPAAMIGHSVGEFVAAALAGVMAVGDAARLVARRGRLMGQRPAGSMLAVKLPVPELEARLPAGLSIAAFNSPLSSVVSGPTPEVEAFRARLETEGVAARALHTSHAFHSSMMDPVVPRFAREVAAIPLAAPQIPILSTVSADWLTDGEARSADYWSRHLRLPVAFSPGIRRLADGADRVFLEVGPRTSLATLVRQHGGEGRAAPLALGVMADSADSELRAALAALGGLWALGVDVDTSTLSAPGARLVRLPTYPFQRQRYWVAAQPAGDQKTPEITMSTPAPVALAASAPAAPPNRRPRLLARLAEVIEEVSGVEVDAAQPSATFVELGLDSLSMTQVALQLQKAFGVRVTFRQLMEDLVSPEQLVAFLDASMTPDPVAAAPVPALAVVPQAPASTAATVSTALPAAPAPQPVGLASAPAAVATLGADAGVIAQLIQQQMELMRQQLTLLAGQPAAASPVAAQPVAASASAPTLASAPAAAVAQPTAAAAPVAAEEPAVPAGPVKYDVKTAFGAIARIHTSQGTELDPRQRARLDAFIKRYVGRTPKSKAYATEHRPHLADPRVVNGFRPLTKEIVYQIVVDRSKGSHLWDIDGNEYVDALNGFGTSLFGWQPEFVLEAVRQQVDRGYEIGPMHPLAGEVARLTAELTGFDRAALCNTGSEAVMGAMRIARTVTGRSKIAIFSGSYHGIFDEVIVRGTKKLRAVPAAPGILPNAAENVLVLDYGTDESLEIVRAQAGELAAVMVEPVQSRRPDFQPREFLHKLREITSASGSVYIFDEVITGFRAAQGGAQEHFGVRADLGTYGKVVGGGYPIGVIAGKREFMDALDGGHWNFGDDSIPTVGVTYFAGTFVRHPLTLAAAHASLLHMKEQGPGLQSRLNERVTAYAEELNRFLRDVGAPIEIRHFASLWRTTFLEEHPLQDLLFAMMRSRGVHILDNFPCFFTTAHSEADFQFITRAYKESVLEMQQCGFLPGKTAAPVEVFDASRPPAPGARLGRDRDGTPAWFVPDPAEKGKFRRYGG